MFAKSCRMVIIWPCATIVLLSVGYVSVQAASISQVSEQHLPTLENSIEHAIPLQDWKSPQPGTEVSVLACQPDFDTTGWHSRKLPWDWTGGSLRSSLGQSNALSDVVSWNNRKTGLRALWLRTWFELPDDWVGKPLLLDLGTIGDSDVTFINGKQIGHCDDPFASRLYTLDPAMLKPGKNLVAIFVRHEAPDVQMAHYHWYWGERELGEKFWPAGIWQTTPSVRLADRQTMDQAGNTPARKVFDDIHTTDRNKATSDKIDAQITFRPVGNTFYRVQGADKDDFQLCLEKVSSNLLDQALDAVHIQAFDIDGELVAQATSPLQQLADGKWQADCSLQLTDCGWYRIEANLLKNEQPFSLDAFHIRGSMQCNYAILQSNDVGLKDDSIFGVCQPAGVDDEAFAAMNAIGAHWLRWDVVWDHWEPAQGRFNFDHPQVGRVVKLCKQYDIQCMPDFSYCAKWAVHPDAAKTKRYWVFSPPRDPREYQDSVKQFVEHFKNDIRSYELWNEPILNHFLIPVEGLNNEQTYQEKIFKPAATAIRSVDPSITVLYASQWAEPFGRIQSLSEFDGLYDGAAIHPYSNDEPDIGAFAGVTNNTLKVCKGATGRWHAAAGQQPAWMTPAQAGKYQLWVTEAGWFPSTQKGELAHLTRNFTRRNVARWVPRAYVSAAFKAVKHYFYFDLKDGLFNDHWQPHPAAVAYATTSHFLEGTKPVALLLPRHGLPIYLFENLKQPHHYVAVSWSRSQQDFFCVLPQGMKAYGLYGNQLGLQDGEVKIGSECVFMTTDSPDNTFVTVTRQLGNMLITGTGQGEGLSLWMKSSQASGWDKAIQEALPDSPERN